MAETKIERLGKHAEIMVHQMKAEGKSYRDIAEAIEASFDEETSHQAIKNYIESHDNKNAELLGERAAKEMRKKHNEELIIDIRDQLEKANSKLEEMMDNLNTSNPQEVGMLLKVLKELRQEWKFQKDYIEQVVNPDTVEQNITQNIEKQENKVDMRVKIINKLKEFEDEGYITIHELPDA